MVGTLAELREHLTAVIAEVREKLSDLRTDVSDAHDLGATVRDHLVRVEQRSGTGTRDPTCTRPSGRRDARSTSCGRSPSKR